MNIVLRAAMVAVSLGTIGPAHAGQGEGGAADTRVTEVPGVVAQAPAQSMPLLSTAQNGRGTALQCNHLDIPTYREVHRPVGTWPAG